MGETSTTGWKPTRRTKFLLMAAGSLTALVMTALLPCLFLGIRSRQDLTAYRAMAEGGFPLVWKDLAWRRIRKGDDLVETFEKHPPLRWEDFGPYTVLLYHKPGSYNTLQIIAANGVLIRARACSRRWEYDFFDSPAHEQAFDEAWSRHVKQTLLDSQAWRIHSAIMAGQDVFLAERVDRPEAGVGYGPEVMRQLEEAYGKDYLAEMIPDFKWTVEVAKVLHGDLEAGTTLMFVPRNCNAADLSESGTVFVHFEDSRAIFPSAKGGEVYLTVPVKALAWYRSLTPEQVRDLEARCLTRRKAGWED